jgi:pyocin large subunit-like protein
MARIVNLSLAVAGLLALAACDGGPASKPSRDQAEAGPAKSGSPSSGRDYSSSNSAGAAREAVPEIDPRTQPAPLVDGKPMWAASRRRTAQESAERQFARNGEDFGAKTLNDYVRKAQAFTSDPPAGAQTFSRPNGDKLIYDSQSNVFAVVSKDGAPRTMFKPEDGPSYWEEAKARASQPRGQRRERSGGDDQG